MSLTRAGAAALVIAAFVALAPLGSGARAADAGLRPLHVVRGAPDQARIVDDRGRQVLLRGVNVNQLGDYYQDDPELEPTFPLTEEDFERIATLGFNVVRLVLSWSALEPEPGEFDTDYLARIERAVAWAKEHDVYVVLDMHQDAWGKHIATPPGETCLPGAEPAIGWDGAPEWATYTDGASTCRYERREASPAVVHAFTNFWLDRPGPDGVGIQQHLVDVWGRLAGAFADEPAVAGYDLLNEPHPGYLSAATSTTLLGRYYDRAIQAIRTAEDGAGGFHHIVFFEPSIVWSGLGVAPPVQPAFTLDENIVFAPHVYSESSAALAPTTTIEEAYTFAAAAAATYRTTFWIGEWGWHGDPAQDAAKVARFAEQQDSYAVGGVWWSWRQACGDPHQIRDPGQPPAPISPSLVRYRCPAGVELGIPEPFATILSRPYPRAAPGRVTALDSDAEAVTLHLEGVAGDASGRLDLWVPGKPPARPVVTCEGIDDVRVLVVDGGFRVTAAASGEYRVDVRLAGPGERQG